ncbi:MAG TPA: response regulator transcription factor [Candidatus Sulfomarinibacteraceae bacterium]|nr:response regulator transcription factor [Candidatus Sulfomarinibacteraceae bacterium]
MDEPIRILIADDHPVFRFGLQALLEAEEDTEVVGEATSGPEAVALAAELQPDVILMDLNMPQLSGLEATRHITEANPEMAILVITMFDDDSVIAAMRAGARGYILKGAEGEETLRAIRAVAHGEAIFSPAVAQRMRQFMTRPVQDSEGPFPELTAREREVLALMAQGLTNTAIAQRLVLSPKTVRNYVSNIFSKLEVSDRAAAIVLAREAGLGTE